jgi:type III secretion system low calcium response chaperone LcrH/SycD
MKHSADVLDENLDIYSRFGLDVAYSVVWSMASLRQHYNISSQELEGLYALAYQKYQTGKYEEAQKLFRVLCSLDQYVLKYLLGFAATERKCGNYDNAVLLYSAAYLVDSDDVRVPYSAGLCHMEKGALKEAESAFYLASHMVVENHEHAKYVEKAMMLLSIVRKRMQNKK